MSVGMYYCLVLVQTSLSPFMPMICLYSSQGVDPTSRETHSDIEQILYVHKPIILYHSISATVDATFTTSCRVKTDDWGGGYGPVSLRCTERGESIEAEDHRAFDILTRYPFKCHPIFFTV